MIVCMFPRLSAIISIVFALSLPAFGQAGSVMIDADMRLFTTMAALNAAGFDVELGSQYHPVREAVRKFADEADPDLISRLRDFYVKHKGTEPDAAQLQKYISLAVSLTDPPSFKIASREELIPPDARAILGFAELLREFYAKARISQRWVELQPQYRQAIAQLGPALRELIVSTDAYLRIPLGNVYSRTLAIYVELAAPLNSVNVRSYQDNYFVVMGGGGTPKIDDVRHAYLHFHLDSLVGGNIARIQNGSALLALLAGTGGVDPAYTTDFHIMATESLIRAVELRMDRTPAARAREAIDAHYRTGLLLVPYFYEALTVYEQREAGIRDYFKEMAAAIKVATEQARFQSTFHQIQVLPRAEARPEVPKTPLAPLANPTRDLLKEAEAAFNDGNNQRARAALEKVLTDYDRNNGAALYGLGLIASREGDSDSAKKYFERAVRSGSAEPSMKVWAYIYLGRMYDLECNRERAVNNYQQAVQAGDSTRDAQNVAREGIRKPYGDGCR